MGIVLRKYNREKDYQRVNDFLNETYIGEGKYLNWLQPRWEYMHFHPMQDESNLNRIGIWEDTGKIVAVVNYEMRLGEAFFHVDPDYTHLKEEMFEYAEANLLGQSGKYPDKKYLSANINDFDKELEEIAESKGYKKTETDKPWCVVTWMPIPNPFPEIKLPEGFRLQSLADDNDLHKVDRVLWRGFNHTGEPPANGIEDRKLMQSAPNFRKDLNIVVVAPNGDFVSYAGIWFEETHKYAYVEPVATDPDYRRMGLGKAAVLEAVRRCGELGATVAYVESTLPIYLSCGFKRIFGRYPWVKYFDKQQKHT
ncbi:GNAT family N-acetyltransferase [Alkaliphilus serpentinus]|uniref:GNAT family N-acetyltransferase n=1 Tax=Alkaliphilus serpentinus TaxID=1482731 RepID=A0A833M5Y4_9FIRM|nr:GNAT family N-acetyltransferase [Alkaliphilus serpentinus]KAB3525659.1 GNAT family N-acetyltransferase [Alkaliphilus serpentinus]